MEAVNKQKKRPVMIELTSATPHEYKSKGAGVVINYGFANTPFGECFIGSSEKGICMFQFCTENCDQLIAELKSEWSNACFAEKQSLAEETVKSLFSFQESEPAIKLWLKGTPFQFKVWKTLAEEIPFGTLTTYKELARLAGYPNAIRAVGSAVAQNPVGYIIPCHRVVRSNGCIGEYHWGPERKKAIIDWEK